MNGRYFINVNANTAAPAIGTITTPAPNLYDGAVGDTGTGYAQTGGSNIAAYIDLGAGVALACNKVEQNGIGGNGAYSLYGSNTGNGSDWVALNASYTGTYSLANATVYRYYLLSFGGSGAQMTDFRLYDTTGAIVVGSAATADFSLTPATQNLVVSNGQGPIVTTPDLTVNALNGYSAGNVALAIAGMPAGMTATLSSNSVAAGSSANLTVTCVGVVPGRYALTITGTNGALTHTQTVNVYVPAAITTGAAAANVPIYTQALFPFNSATGNGTGTQAWLDSPDTGNLLSGPANYTSSAQATFPDGVLATPTNGNPAGSLTVQVPASTLAAAFGYILGFGNGANGSNFGLFDVVAAAPPSAPNAPTFSAITQTTLSVTTGALPAGATSITVKRAPNVAGSPGAYTTIQNSVAAGTYPDSGLAGATKYWYDLVANGPGGTTAGSPASVTTASAAAVVTPQNVIVTRSGTTLIISGN